MIGFNIVDRFTTYEEGFVDEGFIDEVNEDELTNEFIEDVILIAHEDTFL